MPWTAPVPDNWGCTRGLKSALIGAGHRLKTVRASVRTGAAARFSWFFCDAAPVTRVAEARPPRGVAASATGASPVSVSIGPTGWADSDSGPTELPVATVPRRGPESTSTAAVR